MFYSTQILAKKGPLGLVWMAAHMDRGLKRNQVTETSISSTVDVLLSPEAPLALRLSGQLLLGVCRIYARKVSYLLQDCQDALVKIRLAFRPEQLAQLSKAAAAAAAAAQDQPLAAHTLPLDCITLPECTIDELQILTGGTLELHTFQPGVALETAMAELQAAQQQLAGGRGRRRRGSLGTSLGRLGSQQPTEGDEGAPDGQQETSGMEGYSLGLILRPSMSEGGRGAASVGGGLGGSGDHEMEMFDDDAGAIPFDLEEIEIERLRRAPAEAMAGGGEDALAALLGRRSGADGRPSLSLSAAKSNGILGGDAMEAQGEAGQGSPSSGLGGGSRERESLGASGGAARDARRRSTAAAGRVAGAESRAGTPGKLGALLPDLGMDLDLEIGEGALDWELDLGGDEEQGPGEATAAQRAASAGGSGRGGRAPTAEEIRAAAIALAEAQQRDPFELPPDEEELAAERGEAAGVVGPADGEAQVAAEDEGTVDGAAAAADAAEVDDMEAPRRRGRREVAALQGDDAGADAVAAQEVGQEGRRLTRRQRQQLADQQQQQQSAEPAGTEPERAEGVAPAETLGAPADTARGAAMGGAEVAVGDEDAMDVDMLTEGGMVGAGQAEAGPAGAPEAMELDHGAAGRSPAGVNAAPAMSGGRSQPSAGSGGGTGGAAWGGGSESGLQGSEQMGQGGGGKGGQQQERAPVGTPAVQGPAVRSASMGTGPAMATRGGRAAAAVAAAAAAAGGMPVVGTEGAAVPHAEVAEGQPAGGDDGRTAAKAGGQKAAKGVKAAAAKLAGGASKVARKGGSVTVDTTGTTIRTQDMRGWLADRSELLDLERAAAARAPRSAKRQRTVTWATQDEVLPSIGAAGSAALGTWPLAGLPLMVTQPLAVAETAAQYLHLHHRSSTAFVPPAPAALPPAMAPIFHTAVGALNPKHALEMASAAAAAVGATAGPGAWPRPSASAGGAGQPGAATAAAGAREATPGAGTNAQAVAAAAAAGRGVSLGLSGGGTGCRAAPPSPASLGVLPGAQGAGTPGSVGGGGDAAGLAVAVARGLEAVMVGPGMSPGGEGDEGVLGDGDVGFDAGGGSSQGQEGSGRHLDHQPASGNQDWAGAVAVAGEAGVAEAAPAGAVSQRSHSVGGAGTDVRASAGAAGEPSEGPSFSVGPGKENVGPGEEGSATASAGHVVEAAVGSTPKTGPKAARQGGATPLGVLQPSRGQQNGAAVPAAAGLQALPEVAERELGIEGMAGDMAAAPMDWDAGVAGSPSTQQEHQAGQEPAGAHTPHGVSTAAALRSPFVMLPAGDGSSGGSTPGPGTVAPGVGRVGPVGAGRYSEAGEAGGMDQPQGQGQGPEGVAGRRGTAARQSAVGMGGELMPAAHIPGQQEQGEDQRIVTPGAEDEHVGAGAVGTTSPGTQDAHQQHGAGEAGAPASGGTVAPGHWSGGSGGGAGGEAGGWCSSGPSSGRLLSGSATGSGGSDGSMLTRTLLALDEVAVAVAEAAVAVVGGKEQRHDADGAAAAGPSSGLPALQMRGPPGLQGSGTEEDGDVAWGLSVFSQLQQQHKAGRAAGGGMSQLGDQPTQRLVPTQEQPTQQQPTQLLATQLAALPDTQQRQVRAGSGDGAAAADGGEGAMAVLACCPWGNGCGARMSDLTAGKARRDAARCFYDMLVLKSKGLVDMHQRKPHPQQQMLGSRSGAEPGAVAAEAEDGAVPAGVGAAGSGGVELGQGVQGGEGEVGELWVTLTQRGVEAASQRL